MQSVDSDANAGEADIGYTYMTTAGIGVFDAVRRLMPKPICGRIAVLCGKGNNGGDGFVLARLLLDAGYSIGCYCLVDAPTRPEARRAHADFIQHGGTILPVGDMADLQKDLGECALVVDALLGIGCAGAVHGIATQIIEVINTCGVPVVAIDTPSGLSNDGATPNAVSVVANHTVITGFPRPGLFFYPTKQMVGTFEIVDLGYPQQIVDSYSGNIFLPVEKDAAALLPKRRPAGSKFDHGVALVVSGSRGMTGATILVARATLRSGAGMVHCGVPQTCIPALAAQLIEPIIHGLDETGDGTIAASAHEKIIELATRCSAVCIGPGISHSEETASMVQSLVASLSLPVVLDADGLNAFRNQAERLKSHSGELVITPHAGEWQRLFAPLPHNPMAAIAQLVKLSVEYRMTILYKGNPTIVAVPSGKAFVVPYGSSALATAGSGDVLSGIITGLIAQGSSAADATVLGAYLHQVAGNIAAGELTEYGVIASDVVAYLPKAICTLIKESVVDKHAGMDRL